MQQQQRLFETKSGHSKCSRTQLTLTHLPPTARATPTRIVAATPLALCARLTRTGLVIEAKSMFDEPIEIGLIRFADVFDHATNAELERGERGAAIDDGERRKKNVDFDLAHQPLLVIYTTTDALTGDAADN